MNFRSFIIIVGILVIVGGGVFLWQQMNKTAEQDEQTYTKLVMQDEGITQCAEFTDETEQVTCYTELALKQNTAEVCLQAKEEKLQNACLVNFGYENKELAACEYIGSIETKEACVALIIQDAKDREEVCRRLQDTQTLRFICEGFSITKKCEEFENELRKNSCYRSKAEETEDSSWCADITIPFGRDSCYIALAKQLNDYSLCGKVEGESMKKICIPQE